MIAEPKGWGGAPTSGRVDLRFRAGNMKRLLFLCSGLEPGKDGVGDYTRLLAKACQRVGHSCAIAALRDPFVAKEEASLEGEIPALRLPSEMSEEERVRCFLKFRRSFQPDWISLQLVPYAFHRKGLLSGVVPFFSAATAGVPLHLMFHELWLGAGWPSPFRHYLMGRWQAQGIRRMLELLRPQWVTTSNPVYAAMLRSRGATPEILPLFGNIPLALELPALATLLAGTAITDGNREEWWIGLFFGALHVKWKAEPLFSRLLAAAGSCGKKLALVSVGRSGPAGDAIWKHLEDKYRGRITLTDLGEKPESEISALLQSADFGLSASPWRLIGKSGTAAAMLDHGLPVIVSRHDFHPFYAGKGLPSDDPLVIRSDRHLTANLVKGLSRRPPRTKVDEVAMTFTRRLRELQS